MAQQNKKERKARRFFLNIVDAQTHKPLKSIKFTKPGFWFTLVYVFLMLCIAIFCLVAYTPIRKLIPGYPDAHSKREAISNAIKIDSLENVICRWELYSENLRRVVQGDEPLDLNALLSSQDSLGVVAAGEDEPETGSEEQFREMVTDEEQFDLSAGHKRDLPIEGVHFFSPLKGVVSKPYDKYVHPYVDLTAPANSLVMATLDGTVIFTGWNNDAGYTIQIQHSGDIVSIYQHTEKLLKETGDVVKAGTPIALVGSSDNLTVGDHLRFELWYRGEAVDPAKYISF